MIISFVRFWFIYRVTSSWFIKMLDSNSVLSILKWHKCNDWLISTFLKQCHEEHIEQCKTDYEKQCSTEYQNQCSTEYTTSCEQEYKQECQQWEVIISIKWISWIITVPNLTYFDLYYFDLAFIIRALTVYI